VDCGISLRGESMARTLREVIAAVPAEQRAKIAAADRQKLIAEEQKIIAIEKKRQLEETSATWRLIAI